MLPQVRENRARSWLPSVIAGTLCDPGCGNMLDRNRHNPLRFRFSRHFGRGCMLPRMLPQWCHNRGCGKKGSLPARAGGTAEPRTRGRWRGSTRMTSRRDTPPAITRRNPGLLDRSRVFSARQDDTGRAGSAPGGDPRPSLPSGTKDVSSMSSQDAIGENG